MTIRYTPREEVKRRWATKRPAPKKEAPPRPLNLRHVLDLGELVYFTFRGRPYGIPPLAWREGERILDAYLELEAFQESLGRDDLPRYYDAMGRLQDALWATCRPVSRVRRLARWVGLAGNPFRRATERELVELALFILGRRTMSSGFGPAKPPRHQT